MDEILEKNINQNDTNCVPCLSTGFVRLVEVMGDDSSIVQAARVSYGRGTKNVRADRGLIHYLMKHRHTTPFEMVEFKFHVKMPIFVARQWMRHRTASINEISGRYSVMEDVFWEPQVEDLREQSGINRQGSNEKHLEGKKAEEIVVEFEEVQKKIYEQYEKYLEAGVAREVARANLPLSLFTEFYWKMDLHNLFHFLKLRLDLHAQKEIRIYAEAIGKFVKEKCPLSWEAFEEYVLHGIQLSRTEAEIFSNLLKEEKLWSKVEGAKRKTLEKEEASPARIEREISEFQNKFKP